jgi:predicted Zn finger-like uncharacterized protein
MFTVCPKCALTLVVTAADLKVAQGYVRCGRCSNVFNAIPALSEEKQAQAAGLEGYVQPERPDDLRPDEQKMEFDPAATNLSEVFVKHEIGEATGTFEAIVLESDEHDATATEPEATQDEELFQELQSLAERMEAQISQEPAACPAHEVQVPRIDVEQDEQNEPKRPWAWRAGIAALLLLFAVQVVHHYRNDLALHPRLSGPLAKIYNVLGVPLMPRWDLAAYEVHQLGATTDAAGAGQLIVRASLKNAARRAQPLPLLRVSIEDRFGNRLASRDVAPKVYATHANTLLAAGQRVDIELHFSDPGRDAVSFEIDACLLRPGGRIECANAR